VSAKKSARVTGFQPLVILGAAAPVRHSTMRAPQPQIEKRLNELHVGEATHP